MAKPLGTLRITLPAGLVLCAKNVRGCFPMVGDSALPGRGRHLRIGLVRMRRSARPHGASAPRTYAPALRPNHGQGCRVGVVGLSWLLYLRIKKARQRVWLHSEIGCSYPHHDYLGIFLAPRRILGYFRRVFGPRNSRTRLSKRSCADPPLKTVM